MKPVYFQLSTNDAVARLRSDLMLSVAPATERVVWPELPRFISPDPVSGKLETPITWNRYLYCRNDPINYIDPDGRETKVLIPYKDVFGNIKLFVHAAVYIDSDQHGYQRIYDPGGSFLLSDPERRNPDDSLYRHDACINEFTEFHDGNVAIFVFNTTPEQEAQIGEHMCISSTAMGGMCAIAVGNVLQGIGVFENLGPTLTPAMLFRAMVRLQGTQTQNEVIADESETQ